jgi:hypothetical protein
VRTARAAWALLAFVAIAFPLAVRRGTRGDAEMRPPVPPIAAITPPPPAVKLPPPTGAEVAQGLARAFGAAVERTRPARALVGDFNGDGLEDVAVPVRPQAGRIDELNDGLANWWVQDALHEPPQPERLPVGEPALAAVEPGDVLLAVIHGYGPHGWRDQRARQCYLVRNATGPPFEVRTRKSLERYVGPTPEGAPLPGEVILAAAGPRPGFVHWTGSRYRWHALPARARASASAR